jgi:hypothetical protein
MAYKNSSPFIRKSFEDLFNTYFQNFEKIDVKQIKRVIESWKNENEILIIHNEKKANDDVIMSLFVIKSFFDNNGFNVKIADVKDNNNDLITNRYIILLNIKNESVIDDIDDKRPLSSIQLLANYNCNISLCCFTWFLLHNDVMPIALLSISAKYTNHNDNELKYLNSIIGNITMENAKKICSYSSGEIEEQIKNGKIVVTEFERLCFNSVEHAQTFKMILNDNPIYFKVYM